MFLKKLVIAGAALCLMKSAAFAADCGPSGQSIRILASDFPAILIWLLISLRLFLSSIKM